MNEIAVKGVAIIPERYDRRLHERFLHWKNQSGTSLNQIAQMLARSATAVSQYINFKYPGDIPALEMDIQNLLRRQEDHRLKPQSTTFCNITPSRIIWEVLEFCDRYRAMGAAVGSAGLSKTTSMLEYRKRNQDAILLTMDLTRTSLGSVLRMIAKKVNATPYPENNSALLESICERLRDSHRLLIIDEAHLAKWDSLEILREIHDAAGVGIALLGMPRLLSQMRGNRQYLWDQISSRISIFRTIRNPEKSDILTICESLKLRLPKNCLQFLYEKSCGPGKLRTMTKLLNRAIDVSKREGITLNLSLLREIEPLFLT